MGLPGSAVTVAVTSMPRSTREMSVSETLTTTSAQPPQFSCTTGWPGETFWLISTNASATVHACGAVSREYESCNRAASTCWAAARYWASADSAIARAESSCVRDAFWLS